MGATLVEGLVRREVGGIACVECRAWEHENGKMIRHSRRCGSQPQPVYESVEAPATLAESPVAAAADLAGSEKQVAWATSVRDAIRANFDRLAAASDEELAALHVTPRLVEAFRAKAPTYRAAVEERAGASASRWIDTRGLTTLTTLVAAIAKHEVRS